mgnify:FL=1
MKNLKDYILHLDNWISKDILEITLKELSENKKWEQHEWTNSLSYDSQSLYKDKELDVLYPHTLTYIRELHQLTWKALEKYIIIDKISGDHFPGWKGFNNLRFNRYNKNQIMSKHCDHIHNLFSGERRGIPILSIVGVLNDDYQGGEFIMFDNYEIKFKAGDVIIFPSVFLYPHLVKPVKKGTRYSFVSWAW